MAVSFSNERYNSFAIYYLSRDAFEANSVSVDTNIWVNESSNETSAIDFGIRFDPPDGTTKLVIYIPYEVEPGDIEDLWGELSKPEIAHGIFDADIETKTAASDEVTVVHYAQRDIDSDLSIFPIENCFNLEKVHGNELGRIKSTIGSKLIIDLSRLIQRNRPSSGFCYIRFRIPFKPMDQALVRMKSYKDVVTSPFVTANVTAFVEFNEPRGLPRSIKTAVLKSKTSLFANFIILVVDEEWAVDPDKPAYRVRTLEKHLWDSYWPPLKTSKKKFRNRIRFVHQWYIDQSRFTFQFKLSKRFVNARSVLFYLICLIIVSVISEIVLRIVLPSNWPSFLFGFRGLK